MDNNQNGGVDRLMWPFRPIAQPIAIMSHNSEPGTNFEFHFSTGARTAGWTSFHDHLLLQLPD
jgi:hypothetical protein